MKKALFFFILLFGFVWIFINIFYLPFFPWTEGLYRPYLILHNLVPYKDFVWIRTPFDIFLLGGLYAVFGTSEQVYQTTVFSLIIATSLLLFGFKSQQSKLGLASFAVYVILFFPLFINSEIGEIIVGLASLLAFFFIYKYNRSRKRAYLFWAGMSLGFSLITKQTAVLAAFLLVPYLYWSGEKVLKRVRIKNILLYLSGLAIPVSLLTIYLWYKNAVFDFLNYAVFFNLFIYSQWAKPWGFASGIKALAVFISILLPFLILDTRKIIDNRSKFILFLLTFGLLLSIFPSFWSYRLVSAFPLVAIALSVVVLRAHFLLFEHKKNVFKKSIVLISTLLFLVLFYPFLRDYVYFINNNGFSWQQYILDYGENETAAVDWLKKNIKGQEKIFNMANNIIMLRSNHLPHNKYTDQIPVAYYPLDKSYQDIAANPPKTVVFDRSATDSLLVSRDWIKMYKDWKFIKYLNKNYKLIKQFGAIEIYRYEKTN